MRNNSTSNGYSIKPQRLENRPTMGMHFINNYLNVVKTYLIIEFTLPGIH